MTTKIEQHLRNLESLKEDDFSKRIVKPLLEAMGYTRVCFYGGPYEKGRDIIATLDKPMSSTPYVTYIQSKKVGKLGKPSQDAPEFTRLLHQLRQAVGTELTLMDGLKKRPDEVYLAFPEKMDQRFKDEVESQLFDLHPRIEPIDGVRIIELIHKHKPELLEVITPIGDLLTPDIDSESLNKNELNEALQDFTDQELEKYYCDLAFFVGAFDSNILLYLTLTIKNLHLKYVEGDWPSTKRALQYFESNYGLQLSCQSISEIENKFHADKKKYESNENQTLLSSLARETDLESDLGDKIRSALRSLHAAVSEKEESLRKKDAKKVSKADTEAINKKREIIDWVYQAISGVSLEDVPLADDSSFDSEIHTIVDWMKMRLDCTKKMESIKKQVFYNQPYVFDLDCDRILDYFTTQKELYLKGVENLNKGALTKFELLDFLKRTQSYLSFLSQVNREDFLFRTSFDFKKEKIGEDRVSISPVIVFDSGYDIAVYGGAGVGKTTTLKRYARIAANSGSKLVYLSLNHFVGQVKEILNDEEGAKSFKDDMILKLILLNSNRAISPENVANLKASITGRMTVILDGLDEVFNAIPGVLPAITKFKSKFPDTQLIISSRDCVSYLNEIEFLGITLLPFTDEQLLEFIRSKVQSQSNAEKLVESIKEKNSFDYLRTPLLATIMCSLSEHGVVDADSECGVYNKRLKLLTGEYDNFKRIERQTCPPELLQKCSKKLAFSMHKKGVREVSKNMTVKMLIESIGEQYTPDLISRCVEELIDPCNILQKDAVSGLYGFGHFRMQEHLASLEISSNREVDIVQLAEDDWWRGALYIYAQENSIYSVFDDLAKSERVTIKGLQKTLSLMINARPNREKIGLTDMLNQALEAERYDDLSMDRFWDDYGDDY
ncbi:MAG: hypothetical protein VYA55_17445 [Pseudomonadota bacterium]|nr:hypothetical protein [Pseudomonadota bacterium]